VRSSLIWIVYLMLAVVLAACQQPDSAQDAESTASPSVPATTAQPAEAPPAEILSARSEADQARDAGRKPHEVIAFLGIEPGMTVLDVFAASGWYTEVLANAVGPDGAVFAQNTEFLLSMRDGANDKAMAARLAGDRLPNVQRLDRELDDLGLAPDSIDAAMFALNFHDVYNNGGPDAAAGLLQSLHHVLKPGGVLGVIDHAGAPENDNAALHRIEKAKVLQVIEASPFTLDAESDLLANAEDDLSAGVFDPAVRGYTDRFLLRLKKQ
jgi:predicted methyltransferase